MTLPIHDQGGLTEAEIKLAIEESAERREAALDTKLSAHRDEINDRLGRNEERLMDVQGIVAEVKAESTQQTKLLESVIAKGDEWHETDVKFRDDITGRIVKIEAEQVKTTASVKRLSLVGWASYGIVRSGQFIFSKFCEADLWKLLALAFLLYLLHPISPFLYSYVLKLAAH